MYLSNTIQRQSQLPEIWWHGKILFLMKYENNVDLLFSSQLYVNIRSNILCREYCLIDVLQRTSPNIKPLLLELFTFYHKVMYDIINLCAQSFMTEAAADFKHDRYQETGNFIKYFITFHIFHVNYHYFSSSKMNFMQFICRTQIWKNICWRPIVDS